MTPAAPRYLSAGLTDQGPVRENNEDRVYCDDVRGIYLVVDGMGGHEAGEQAAAIAVERIRARLERQTGSVEQRVREAITLANNAIFEAGEAKPEWKGMACVLTAAVIEDSQVTIGHVGDSRLYRIKRGAIDKVTHDHSPVGEREDSGELSESEAMKHPRRNEVYRDVGSEAHTPDDDDFIEIRRIPFEPDSALLLCSDGLSDAISSKQILQIVEKNAGDRKTTVRALLSAATGVGKDNVSAILVEGERFAASFGRRPAARKPKRAIITDPQAVAPAGPVRTIVEPRHVPWYASGGAWLLYGLVLGGLLVCGIQRYFFPPPPPRVPRTLLVQAPETIAAVLEKALPGDIVSVAPGTYAEGVHLKDGIEVVARRAHESVIEGGVFAESIRHGRFEGFVLRSSGDVGVRIHNSDLVLARNEISGAKMAGVDFTGNSRGSISACWIHDNPGTGIMVRDSATPAIENNLIVSNGTAANTARPGLLIESALRPTVAANIFLGNGAEPVWLPEADQSVIDRNYFTVSGKPDKRPKFRVIRPSGSGRESR